MAWCKLVAMQKPARLLPMLLALGACATQPPMTFPSQSGIAAGRPVAMHRNDPMGSFGTMALMASAPRCGYLPSGALGQPLRLRDLAGRAVSPAFPLAPGACPAANDTGVPYLPLDRAVVLTTGLYAAGATHECFLPNEGGGQCREVTR